MSIRRSYLGDVDSVVSHLSKVVRHNDYYSACCPFHDDNNPSLLVYSDGFICLSCRERGSLEKLYAKVKGEPLHPQQESRKSWLPTDIWEQKRLCFEANRVLQDYYHIFGSYLGRRGIHEDMAMYLKLGYHDGWYTIPIYDRCDNHIGMVARASPTNQERTGMRYLIPPGQPPLLYIPVPKKIMELTVVYGIIDAIILAQAGVLACSPSSGKDSLKADMLDWHRGLITIIPDKKEEQTSYRHMAGLDWRAKVVFLDYDEAHKDVADYHQNLKFVAQAVINKLKEDKNYDGSSVWENVLSGRQG